MLVDDEPIVIQELKGLIKWENHGFEIVAEAGNGKKALELYQKFHPQVIFVDIRMPVMDGLEFCRKIHSENRSVKVILLTAYKDFDYARQAIQLGVSNYLLKYNMDEYTLLQELEKIKSDLADESKNEKALIQNKIIQYTQKGNQSFEQTEEDKHLFASYGEQFILWVIQLDQPYPLLHIHNETQYVPLIDLTGTLKFPDGYELVQCVDMNNKLSLILISSNKYRSKKEIWEQLYPLAVKFQDMVFKDFKVTISVAVSVSSKSSIELPDACKRALRAIIYSVFYGRAKVFGIEDIPLYCSNDEKRFLEVIKDVEKNIAEMNFQGIKENVETLYDAVINPHWDMNGFNKVCIRLIDLLNDFRSKNNLDSLDELVKRGMISTDNWYCVKDMFHWFIDHYLKTLTEIKDVSFNGYSKLLKQACLFIQEHYHDDLTIEVVADKIKISSVWLSKLFKKETGITFLDFLTHLRIKKAEEMLKNSDYKIYEIAEIVGYKTSQHFCKIFTRMTGINPMHFRNRG